MCAPQPGTLLPWAICDNPPNDSWYNGRTLYGVPEGVRIGDLSKLRRADDMALDAAYIVHACNNYPKAQALADALRECALELRIMGEWTSTDSLRDEYLAKFERATAALAAWDAKP